MTDAATIEDIEALMIFWQPLARSGLSFISQPPDKAIDQQFI